MKWPHLYSRACGQCGCSLEECECKDRKVRALLQPPPQLYTELQELADSVLVIDEDPSYRN